MRFINLLVVSSGLLLVLNVGVLSFMRQQTPEPAWVIFASDHEGTPAIYRLRGKLSKRLTEIGGHYESPAWSPDGRWLVFTAKRSYNSRTLILKNPHSHRQTPILYNFDDMGAPVWSPDGEWIAFAGVKANKADIYRVRFDGRDLQKLTFSVDRGNWSPAWSPDGEWIAFTQANERSSNIYRMRPDGSGIQRISNSHWDNWMPVWSSDSQWIVFLSDRDSEVEMYKMRADGSEEQRIGQRPSYTWSNRLPSAWDGEWIILDAFRRGTWGVYRMKSDGTGLEAMPHLPADNKIRATATWSPIVDMHWRGLVLLLIGSGFAVIGAYWQRLL